MLRMRPVYRKIALDHIYFSLFWIFAELIFKVYIFDIEAER